MTLTAPQTVLKINVETEGRECIRVFVCFVLISMVKGACARNPCKVHTQCALWWLDPVWVLDAHQSHSVTPLLSWTEGEKYDKRLMG